MTSLREFFSLPMAARGAGRDTQVAVDELGRPVYRDQIGTQYAMGQQPRGDGFGEFMQRLGDEPWQTTKDIARGLVQGAVSGVTAPGRALQGQPVTYGDVADTAMDWGVMSAATLAPSGALRAGALRSVDDVAETPAQTVARLLREGRASDVTDDMMARIDPQEMARLYESGTTGMDMPLDEASRIARAREMGFDTGTPLYHGTGADFDAFSLDRASPGEQASFFSSSPEFASEFSELSHRGQNVVPAVAAGRRFPADFGGYYYTPERMEHALRVARGGGADALETRNMREAFGPQEIHNATQVAVFDPRNIRSRFARFDPRLSHLANLSAGIGAGAIMLPQDDGRTPLESLQAYIRGNRQ